MKRRMVMFLLLLLAGCGPSTVYRTEVLPEMKKATQEIGQMTGSFYKEYFKPNPIVRGMPRVRPVRPDLRVLAERDRLEAKRRMAEIEAQQRSR